MRKQFAIAMVSSVLSLGILGIGLSTVGFTRTQEAKHIGGSEVPHQVPPQLQGKPAQPNPDPGIASPYQSKANDNGIVSAVKPVQERDKGIILQYPPSSKPPNAHPASPGPAPKTKNTR